MLGSRHVIKPRMMVLIVLVVGGYRIYSHNFTKQLTQIQDSPPKEDSNLTRDDIIKPELDKQLGNWPKSVRARFTLNLHPVEFPQNVNQRAWKKLFRPCATQRIFLPTILQTDAVIYVDTDVLFLRPPEQLWSYFYGFNTSHVAALAGNQEYPLNPARGYNANSPTPYVLPSGLNSGVILMNLTKMREVGWVDRMIGYFDKYRAVTRYGDQDLINAYFHFFPGELYRMGCNWNYRTDHCRTSNNTCVAAEREGIGLLHGNRGIFHRTSLFASAYTFFQQLKFTANVTDMMTQLRTRIRAEPGGAYKPLKLLLLLEQTLHA